MAVDQAKQYLTSLATDQAARTKLQSALGDDIVKAGAAAGFTFTEAELAGLLGNITGGGGSPNALGTSIGWS